MQTRVLDADNLSPAIEALAAGELVAFPTETVYGLGADGFNADACRRIFVAKGRPSDNPLILHVRDRSDLQSLTAGPLLPTTEALIQAFWPGPLTVVVPSQPRVPEVVRAGLDTVAVRAPSHPVARALISGLGRPIAAPSANLSGRPSPTTLQAVLQDMQGRVPYVIDGGATLVGVESTVVDCTVTPPVLLRPGAISAEMVAGVVGALGEAGPKGPPRSPGMKYRHYAPKTPLVWVKSLDPAVVARTLDQLSREYGQVAWAAPDPPPVPPDGWFESLGEDAATAAHRLFHVLRTLDQRQPGVIAVMWQSESDLGLAIANRIGKAAVCQVGPS